MAKNILVIEDEELMSSSLLWLLEKSGYNVTVANNGEEALLKVKNMNFNLIIVDVRMPCIDGIDTLSNIRDYFKKSGNKLVPEIIITGYADENSYKRAMDLGVADYIYKPFESTEILKAIRSHIL